MPSRVGISARALLVLRRFCCSGGGVFILSATHQRCVNLNKTQIHLRLVSTVYVKSNKPNSKKLGLLFHITNIYFRVLEINQLQKRIRV
jgi:iron-sulfur cluster repair protein YtfE (RIC family)